MDEIKLWENFLNLIKDKVSPISYETWFSDTKLHKIENKTIYIIVPMNIHKKYTRKLFRNIKRNYKWFNRYKFWVYIFIGRRN